MFERVQIAFVGVIVVASNFWWKRRCWRGAHSEVWDVVAGSGPVRFSYQKLLEVTNNFNHPLGEGGYGKVYKGWIKNKSSSVPAMEVAVKVLKQGQKEKQFRAEIGTLSKIHHFNLVELLCFCIAGCNGEKMLLVYDYMENGSLDRYLSPSHMQQPLPCSVRLSIAVGTARGIAYLHHDCIPPILHCDIKPQNLLLDKNFNPKVSDFGFAHFCQMDQSHLTMSGIRGTRGYMASDWLKSGAITSKADVYSFGTLLLELIHGLNTTGGDNMTLIQWGFECLVAGSVNHPDVHAHHNSEGVNVHPQSDAQVQAEQEEQEEWTQKQQLHLLRLAVWCVQQLPASRPSMLDVVQLIEGSGDIKDPQILCMHLLPYMHANPSLAMFSLTLRCLQVNGRAR